MESSNRVREKEAAALREWFLSQSKYGSWVAMERALKITEDYLQKIKSGTRRAIDPVLRAKLYEATGLEIFKKSAVPARLAKPLKPVSRKILVTTDDLHKPTRGTSSLLPRTIEEEASKRAAEVRRLLVGLAEELEFFKGEPESVRKIFRKTVPGEDIGYITTLLRALYDEDQFQRWLLFSQYKLKSKEEK